MACSLSPTDLGTSTHTGVVVPALELGYRYATTLRSETGVGGPTDATATDREPQSDPESGPW